MYYLLSRNPINRCELRIFQCLALKPKDVRVLLAVQLILDCHWLVCVPGAGLTDSSIVPKVVRNDVSRYRTDPKTPRLRIQNVSARVQPMRARLGNCRHRNTVDYHYIFITSNTWNADESNTLNRKSNRLKSQQSSYWRIWVSSIEHQEREKLNRLKMRETFHRLYVQKSAADLAGWRQCSSVCVCTCVCVCARVCMCVCE